MYFKRLYRSHAVAWAVILAGCLVWWWVVIYGIWCWVAG